MPKFEYETDVLRDYEFQDKEKELLNTRGENGWELVSVLVNPDWVMKFGVFYYWKRKYYKILPL